MSNVPPAATVILPPTSMNSASVFADRLYFNIPFTVVVLAVAVLVSTVTVVPAAITTALQDVGTIPESHVLVLDQLPVWIEVKVLQPSGCHFIRPAVSF